jgi:hypothetical protein
MLQGSMRRQLTEDGAVTFYHAMYHATRKLNGYMFTYHDIQADWSWADGYHGEEILAYI